MTGSGTPRGQSDGMTESFLPGVPAALVHAAYAAAPGNEIDSGKFTNPESSAALAANAFGWFLERPEHLPPLPLDLPGHWSATGVALEQELRFPWSGGRHPWLDAVVTTPNLLLGIESKRYEPFRGHGAPSLSAAYDRPVWGDRMARFTTLRDVLRSGDTTFGHLDAAQLVKHALGLRTAVHRPGPWHGKQPVMVYLYAEPAAWPDGRPVKPEAITAHRAEIDRFLCAVNGDEVTVRALSYAALLQVWRGSGDAEIAAHADRVADTFGL